MPEDNRVFTVTIRLGEPESAAIVNRGFIVTWNPPGNSQLEVCLNPNVAAQLATFVEAIRSGAFDFDMIRGIAPTLSLLLGTDQLRIAQRIQLAEEGTTVALTDIPWEAATRGHGPLPTDKTELFTELLASLPIWRSIPSKSYVPDIEMSRPRVLLCISNPPGIGGGQIAIGAIQTSCEQALQEHPVFLVKVVKGALIWPSVRALFPLYRPNIVILVGHGASNPAGGSPTLAFVREGDAGGVERIPADEIAKAVAGARSSCLVALIACDLVRTSGYSAACEFVRQGVPEVLAMQGSIQQQSARAILVTLLSEVLVGTALPQAAAAARRASIGHPHAILPVVFRASDRPPEASDLAPLAILYNRALGDLYVKVKEPRRMLNRDALQKEVKAILTGSGVVTVKGSFGNGSSTVLRAAVASVLAEKRNCPFVYLDCEQRLGGSSLSQWVSDQLRTAISANPVLKPLNSPGASAWPRKGDELGTWAVEAEISIVLDNLPFNVAEEDRVFVESLAAAYRRPDIHACLVLGGESELLESDDTHAAVVVGPLSLRETTQYAKEFTPGRDGSELYAQTGGTLLLLEAERRAKKNVGSAGLFEKSRAVELYLNRLEQELSPEAWEAAARLSFFPFPINMRVAKRFVVPDLQGTIEELLEYGLLMSFEDGTITWLLVPQRKSDGIQARNDPESIETALTERFSDEYDSHGSAVIDEIISLSGSAEYLETMQRALAASGRTDVAIQVAFFVQGTSFPAVGLFKLFRQAIEILDAAQITDPILLADALLAGSRAALGVGEAELAQIWFERIPQNLDDIYESRRLALKAAILKDQHQAKDLQEILLCFSAAADLATHIAAANSEEYDRLRREIVFDSLPAALFLSREPAESAANRLQPILPQFLALERAQLLATFAEREMKERRDKANWARIADWVTEAANLADGAHDDRAITYCKYQQAQYLRKRPQPRYEDAWRTYEVARAAGNKAGESRREGLALIRLLELEHQFPQLREHLESWAQSRLLQVDNMAAKLLPAQIDALSMRVLGMLQLIASALDPVTQSRRERLTEAARAFSSAVLNSRTDNYRFAEVCKRALDLDLSSAGDFLLAQRFLASFRFEIEQRLDITVDLDQPQTVCNRISEWLIKLSLEGGSDGQQ